MPRDQAQIRDACGRRQNFAWPEAVRRGRASEVGIHCIQESFEMETLQLSGTHIRLEPLDHRHVDGLAAAAAGDRSLYQWSPVPQSKAEAASYVDTALA